MALAIREQRQSTAANTDFVFTLGADTQVGDLAVLLQANNWYEASNLSTPTGTAVSSWSLRTTGDGGVNAQHVKVWTGAVTTGGAQTVDTNWTTTDEERFATVFIISGGAEYADAQSTISGTGSTSHVAPSVTPNSGVTDNILMCVWGCGSTSGSGSASYSVPGSMTGYTEVNYSFLQSYKTASEIYTSSSATGTRTATASSSFVWCGASVIVSASTPPVVDPLRLPIQVIQVP